MSPLVSRILVAAVLLPLVIGLVYLGGWWLFALAIVGGLLALHELYVMARELRPLVLGGYLGFVTTLLGLQLGGIDWMLGGLLATFVLAFVVYGLGGVRQSAYAELVFDETYWPDFGEDRLRAAVEEFASRGRRFGAR